jgi:peptidoglycan hydrolase-like protein with peptidoglycan-binding domain
VSGAVLLGERDQIYLSFDEAAVDAYDPALDADDSLLAEAPWVNPAAAPLSAGADADLRRRLERLAVVRFAAVHAAAPTTGIVPHPRDLRYKHPYMVGWDVYALQRALSEAGLRRWGTFTRTYGPGTRDEVKAFQRKRGLHVDGVYGPATHRKLAPFYDAHGIKLLSQVRVRTVLQKRQAEIAAAAINAYNRRAVWHYTQGPARMWIVRHHIRTVQALAAAAAIYEDCSSTVTGVYYLAELEDPNNLGYNGQGFTGTLAAHGILIPSAGAPIGAYHLYGHGYPWKHTTLRVTTAGRVLSMGTEAGPLLLDAHYRTDLYQTRIGRQLLSK